MENKKIFKIVGLLALSGVIIGFSIKPIKKMIDNYRGQNTPKPNSDNKPITVNKPNIISKIDADKIVSDIKNVYNTANKRGGMTAYDNKIKNELVDKLGNGGYKIQGNLVDDFKAILK